MLLDEPLSNLDPKLRETMRFEIKELQKKFNFTIIFVTHDQSEAMALSDRMMVMDMGNIVQIGTPTELYNRPVNRFVHKFLGQSTFTDVVIQDGKVYAKGDMAQPLPVALPENGEREMVMATRPNQIAINHTDGYKTKIEKRIFLTNYTEYLVRVGDQLLQVQTPHRNAFAQGETCYLKFPGIMWYGREDEQAEAERNRPPVGIKPDTKRDCRADGPFEISIYELKANAAQSADVMGSARLVHLSNVLTSAPDEEMTGQQGGSAAERDAPAIVEHFPRKPISREKTLAPVVRSTLLKALTRERSLSGM